ncbi:MAG TPA: RHS repeat-associated core domain-containing protein [Methylomirabilota bacterium]|nr:RHS repeat-associated core domain-containing protein [Methylomirabilota bacterium]
MLASLGFGLALITMSVVSTSGPRSQDHVAHVPGQTWTLLPDGTFLVLGGLGPAGPLTAAALYDSHSGLVRPLPFGLGHGRAWHTATLVPDGSVLIVGGIGAAGVVQAVERFDPATQEFETVDGTGLTARSFHTATVLTDGRLLVAGGMSAAGDTLATAESWDLDSWTLQPLQLNVARQGHVATLWSDGSVVLWGGASGTRVLDDGERFDPVRGSFATLPAVPSDSHAADPPQLETSIPRAGGTDVPVDSVLTLRFSKPLRVETVSSTTVTLTGSRGLEEALVVPVEGGRLAFITPRAPLAAGAAYVLTLNGPVDSSGALVPFGSIPFTTAGPSDSPRPPRHDPSPPASGSSSRSAAGREGWEWTGAWRDGRPYSSWQALPPLQAPPGTTALAGQVLRLDGEPLAGVTLETGSARTRTDETGRFLLAPVEAGHQELLIDGRSANRDGMSYGVFEIGVDLTAGRTNVWPFTSWMPVIDTANAIPLPARTTDEIVVRTPRITGLEVRIPPGAVVRDHEGRVATEISLTPVPQDRPPFPLPPGIDTPAYFTIQPGAGYIDHPDGVGARVIYPNYADERRAPAGTRFDFYHYDPGETGWHVYGGGSVNSDGTQVVPDLGVAIYEFTGAMITNSLFFPPDIGPAAGGCACTGDPVDLGTGLFLLRNTDLFLGGLVPLALTRTYRSQDTANRPFGIGTNHPYGIFLWSAQQYQEADLVLPDGGRIHYVRISPGTGINDAVFEHTSTPTTFYKSRITRGAGPSGWDLTLRDGTLYHFGENAPLQYIQDRYGNRVTITRAGGSTSGSITRVAAPGDRWIDFGYDAGNRITRAQDNLGRVASYAYDASGRLTTVTDSNGGVTRYTYDASHRMLSVTDPRGVRSLLNEYDASGRVIRQTRADSTDYRFAYTLDAAGKIVQTDVTDPRANVRRVVFNSGYAVSDTSAVGWPEQQTVTYERQAGSNFILSATDALGRKTAYGYDPLGNVTAVTMLAGTAGAVTTAFTYEPVFSRMTGRTDPLGHTTALGYDSSGSLISITSPLAERTTLSYDRAGQPLTITDPAGTTRFTYDLGDLVAVTDPLGHTITRFTDDGGRLVSLTNPLGQRSHIEYDALNHVTRVTDPAGGVTGFAYDATGNIVGVTTASGGVTAYSYDSMGRVTTRTDPRGEIEGYQYDANGNLTAVMDRKAQVRTMAYDALNRRMRVTYANGSTTAYAWDAANRLTQVVDSLSGTITRSYDLLDRLIQEVTPQGTVSFTWDAAGRRTSMTVSGQLPVTYVHDDADRVTGIAQGAAAVGIGYDAASRRTSLALPGGVVTEYAYDAASRLTGLTYRHGASVLGTLTYAYDAAGNRTQLGGTWARTGLPGPLISATYDAADRQTSADGRARAYDRNGNLLSDGFLTYTWDARDQLVGLNGPGVAASFLYDGIGRRHTTVINGVSTQFTYDDVTPVREQSGPVTVGLLTGLGVDEYFIRAEPNGTYGLLTDVLGSTIAVTDAAGALQAQYTYEPFGVATVTGTASNAFQYTGRENDGTGLYYYRARYYAPNSGRFISEDPLPLTRRALREFNAYAYARNNPLMFMDPLGESAYCGSGWTSYFIPDSWYGLYDFSSACHTHDECYEQCGKSQKACDEEFLKNMEKECRRVTWWRTDCLGTAKTYYLAVRNLGSTAYKNAQAGCQCPL